MQIIILGMHRSGTSMLARLVNMMGVYFGEDVDAIGANDENPKGFWERQDVRKLNDKLLHSAGLDWDQLSQLTEDCFLKKDIDEFEESARTVIANLNNHTNWLLKEPRLNILLKQWKNVLDQPIYLYVYRTPIEVALSLKARNEIPRSVGVALWELYNKQALKHIDNLEDIIFVSHSLMMTDPVGLMGYIFEQLIDRGVVNIHRLNEQVISEFISPELHRQKQTGQIQQHINVEQLELYKYLSLNGAGHVKFNATDLSTIAQENLEDYEITKRIKNNQLALEAEKAELIKLNAETLKEINEILDTNRWKLGNHIITVANVIRGNAIKSPTFINRVLEISKRLDVHSRK